MYKAKVNQGKVKKLSKKLSLNILEKIGKAEEKIHEKHVAEQEQEVIQEPVVK